MQTGLCPSGFHVLEARDIRKRSGKVTLAFGDGTAVGVEPSVRRFGRYEAARLLGRGAMGEVFEGRHVDLGTRVAIKVLHGVGTTRASTLRRAVREGRAVAAIAHPNIVSVLDVGVEDGLAYLVMELLHGTDLGKRLARDGAISLDEATDLVLPVCSALSAAHLAGIVHRDIKPSNIFLAQRHGRLEPTLIDFGISRSTLHGGESSSSDRAGTPAYMAPEQLRGKEATPLTDQYALAVLLYECVTGSVPFVHEDPYELVHAIMTDSVVPPSDLNPQLPAALDAIVLRGLERRAAMRFDGLKAFGEALLAFASKQSQERWAEEFRRVGSARRPPSTYVDSGADDMRNGSARRRLSVPLAMGTLATALLATGYLLSRFATHAHTEPRLTSRVAIAGSPSTPNPSASARTSDAPAVATPKLPSPGPPPTDPPPTDPRPLLAPVRLSQQTLALAARATARVPAGSPRIEQPAVRAGATGAPATAATGPAPVERGTGGIPIVE